MVKLWVAAKSAVIHTGGVERTYRSHTIFLPFSISLVLYLVLLAYRAVDIYSCMPPGLAAVVGARHMLCASQWPPGVGVQITAAEAQRPAQAEHSTRRAK